MSVDRRRFAGNQFGTSAPEDRFWAYVKKGSDDECWPWTAAIGKKTGYGVFGIGKKTISAHVFSFNLAGNEIPDGYTLDHICHTRDKTCPGGLCEHRKCANPNHLEAVPRGINTLRGKTITAANILKTHCPQGHEYTEANTVHEKRGLGMVRVCRTCRRNRRQEKAA